MTSGSTSLTTSSQIIKSNLYSKSHLHDESLIVCMYVCMHACIHQLDTRDLTASLLSEVCHNASTEPHLQPMTGEVMSGLSANIQDGDIAADVFWGSRSGSCPIYGP